MGKTRIGDLVSDNLLSTDIDNDRVGIGSTLPSSKLDVDGDVNVSGVVTANSFSGSGTNLSGIVTSITAGDNISIDSSTGNVTITGLANTANVVSDTIDTGSLNVTGIASATSFSGSGINLTGIVTSITAGSNISVDSSTGSVTITGLANTANVVSDTIDTGSLNVTGIASATSFSGNGTNLSGIVTSITAGDNISIDSSTGSVTITGLANTANVVSDTIDTGSLSVTGITTLAGNTNISGDITSNVTIVSTDTGSSAAPEFTLYRNSASPSPGDYLGQIMFKGENSNGGEENYAKITGKISDETLGTEDGLIETAIKGDGSFTIVSRQRSDELQLINGVGLSVDGDSTFTGGIDVDGHTELDNVNVSGVVTTSKLHVDPVGSGFTYTEDLVVLGNARVTGILSIGTSSIVLDANAKTIRGLNEIRLDSDDEDDEPVIVKQRKGKITFKKTRRNNSNQLIEVEQEASVGIGTTVSVNTTGIITALSFHGDGSNLTGLTHSQVSGVMVNLVEDTTPQLGGNLDLNSNDITGTGNINITGSGTFSGNVSIAGTLTYEDVTNVDSVGLISARSGVDVTGNITVTGTVDGRDIASDGSKLDGIESGATADQTAAEILTLIKTVDGSGSGLDADLWDGNQFASYLNQAVLTTSTPSFNQVITTNNANGTNVRIGDDAWIGDINSANTIRVQGVQNSARGYIVFGNSNTTALGRAGTGELTYGGDTVWHAGNDGSGSGLDADLLDGVQGSSYLRSDANDTYDNGQLDIRSNSTNGHYWGVGIEWSSGWKHTNTNSWGFAFRNSAGILDIYSSTAAGTAGATATYKAFRIGGSSSLLQYNGNTVWHAGNDGSGSGLDADTVDGIQGASFLRSDANDSATGLYSFAAGAYSANVTYGGRSIQTVIDINSTSMRGGVLVRNANDFRSETDTASFMHYDAYNTSATSYAFRASTGTTLADTFWVKGDGSAYFGNNVEVRDGALLVQTAGNNTYGLIKGYTNNNHFIGIRAGVANQSTLSISAVNKTSFVEYAQDNDTTGWYWLSSHINYGEIMRLTRSAGLQVLGNKVWHAGNDGAGSGLDADTVDGIQASSFAQLGGATFTGDLRVDNDADLRIGDGAQNERILIQKADNNVSDHIIFYNGTTRIGEIGVQDTTWLRINQVTNKNIYTPRYIRADGGFFVDGTTYGINGTGVLLSNTGATIGGNTAWHAGNDGAGSGLDADNLDGLSSASFLRSNATDQFDGQTSGRTLRFRCPDGRNAGSSSGSLFPLEIYQNSNVSNSDAAMTFHISGRYAAYFGLNRETNDLFFGGWSRGAAKYKIWHAANDGSGSGLDADTVDGISSASFLRSDANDTLSAIITGHASNTEVLRIRSSSYSTKYIYYGGWSSSNSNDISRIRTSGNLHIDSPANGNLYFNWYASNRTIYLGNTGQTVYAAGSNTVWHAGNDGSGSGLDADTVDGIQGSALAPIASPTFTGNLTIPSAIVHAGDTNTYIQFHTTDQFRVVCAGAEVQEWGNNYTKLNDNDQLRLGTGSDFRMWFNGADTYFRNYAHANGDIIFQGENSGGTNQNLLILKTDGARSYCILYENSQARLTTTSGGVSITGTLTATGNVTAYSDIKLKKNIEVIPDALDKVSQIRGITFDRIDIDDEPRQSGVIAQEVEKVLPEVVRTAQDGTKTVAYGNMVGLLIESIKELKAEVETLKKEHN